MSREESTDDVGMGPVLGPGFMLAGALLGLALFLWVFRRAFESLITGVVEMFFLAFGPAIDFFGLGPTVGLYLILCLLFARISLESEGERSDNQEDEKNEDPLAGTVTVWTADGEAVRFEEAEFEPRRLRVGDRLTWVADHGGEPVELDVERLGFDPAERARQAYVDDEIDEDELERRLGHDIMLEENQ